jgi:preprotein translocase subunit SecY
MLKAIMMNLPEVSSPTQKKLSFKEKLKWTLIILVLFFVLGHIPLFGLGDNQLQQFEFLSMILGASFGSIISLGIGPIVTASIVLQLLNGSGIVKFDLTSHDGKKNYQATQKMLVIGFIIFEAIVYVFMGGLSPGSYYDPVSNTLLASQTSESVIPLTQSTIFSLQILLIIQLIIGGIMILFMDEVISKWGFGSGISLFIAAGVSQTLFIQAFSPFASYANPDIATGAFPKLIQSLAGGLVQDASKAFFAIAFTFIVFALAVYAQAMKVEIPLSFGRVRGYGIRWPLSFIYTSVIPVILVAALLANFQLAARLLENWLGRATILGGFNAGGGPASGFIYWVSSPNIVEQIIQKQTILIGWEPFVQAICYISFMMAGCVIFSIFWVQTAGMDSSAQAKNIMGSGLQIPGFRKDKRVLERLLDRYIWPLAIMGSLSVGFLAAIADLTGSLASGTGILLTVMIVYKLYEEVAQQHMMDMNPMMRKFMGK